MEGQDSCRCTFLCSVLEGEWIRLGDFGWYWFGVVRFLSRIVKDMIYVAQIFQDC